MSTPDATGAQPLAVSPTTAAELLDTSRATIYKLIASGALPAHRLPGLRSTRIPYDAIRALAEGNDQ